MASTSKRAMLEQIRTDIDTFKDENLCDRLVMIWCGSTEIYIETGPAHADLEAFEAAIDAEDPSIAPSMLYAYAALQEGVPFANGAPNLAVDTPVLRRYAEQHGVPISGKDFKTGQTLLKTVLAPMLKARMLGLSGWYSTNILGNRDGEVLDDPENFKTKEVSKLGVLEDVLEPERFPELYGDVYHKVRINYYPPRGDNKEGWDNIDLFGWMGYPMQMKVDFLCRDSILAAPLALDLVLFMDLAQRAGMGGIQEWLSFYFKSPQVPPGLYPEHDLFIQLTKLKNTLRWMMGETPITHLGQDYDELRRSERAMGSGDDPAGGQEPTVHADRGGAGGEPRARGRWVHRAAGRVRPRRDRAAAAPRSTRCSPPTAPERSRTDAAEFRYEMLNRSAAAQAAVGHPAHPRGDRAAARRRLPRHREHRVAQPARVRRRSVALRRGTARPPARRRRVGRPDPVSRCSRSAPTCSCRTATSPTARRWSCPAATDRAAWRRSTGSPTPTSPTTADHRSLLTGAAGDVSLFVSDCWHAGRPAGPGGRGRYFLQAHYGRRDIAQRLRTTDVANQLSDDAIARADTPAGP